MANPVTLRSDETAAAEFVNALEDFFGPDDKIRFKFAKEKDGREVFYAHTGIGKKSGVLFRTATAEARESFMKFLPRKGLRTEQVNSDILTSYISATVGTELGGDDVKLLKLDESIVGAKLGYGIGTGNPTHDHSLVMKITSTEIGDAIPLEQVIAKIPADELFAAVPLKMISDAIPRH